MNNYSQISITSAVEPALNKLNRAKIPVYNVKKRGNKLYFEVKDEYLQKVFAIFSHMCYNINVSEKSNKKKLADFALQRLGLFFGLILFVATIVVSNLFVLKIEVTGSGSFLENQIIYIINDCGLHTGSYYNQLDKPLALSRIMALPNVTFCSIERKGSFILIDVQADSESDSKVNYSPLYSDVDGQLKELVVICGNEEIKVGNAVKAGQLLIGAYSILQDGSTIKSLAVGYAVIECTRTISYNAQCESDENKTLALKSVNIYTDSPYNITCNAKKGGEGIIYEVTFSYLHTISINME